MILHGNCLDKLKELEDSSVDSIVTDPPYELGFMGKSWDNTGIAYNPEMWAQCLRVLKPGGHLLAFSGTRTYHRMAVAIEDAGFEIRDMVEWVYGSGFPKSLNIGKAVDKIQGNEREVVGTKKAGMVTGKSFGMLQSEGTNSDKSTPREVQVDKGNSKWEGWGTALKPAHEPICLARKPIEGTVANNVLKYGTGGLNIDKSRVEATRPAKERTDSRGRDMDFHMTTGGNEENQGRFPANLLHDGSDEVVREFPNMSGAGNKIGTPRKSGTFFTGEQTQTNMKYDNGGSAARFFKSFLYCPKASKSERDRGCEGMEAKRQWASEKREASSFDIFQNGKPPMVARNNHPTVKPLALMKYLIQMITPEGGVVLDPFAGSGSTLVAAKELGYDFIGIEMTEEYIPIIEARLSAVREEPPCLF